MKIDVNIQTPSKKLTTNLQKSCNAMILRSIMWSMQLSNHSISQLDEEEILNLSEEVLRCLSVKLLIDLKEAHEQLNQISRNSSRPPSSEAPCDKDIDPNDFIDESEELLNTENTDKKEPKPLKDSDQVFQQTDQNGTVEQRKPGKQPGAESFGRQQTLAITDFKEHLPELCACCFNP